MEDLDRKEYVASLTKAETEDEKKAITKGKADYKRCSNHLAVIEFAAQEMKLRKRSLGNIRFIGELYKIKMLNGKFNFVLYK